MKGKWEADVLWAMAWLDMTREQAENYIRMYRHWAPAQTA